jgi:hypothetical protein
MTTRILIAALLIAPCCALAQDEDDKRFSETLTQYHTIGAPVVKIDLPLVFTAIHVYDARYDTTCIGVVKNALVFTNRQLKKTVAVAVADFYKASITTSANGEAELYCFIKRMTISESIDIEVKSEAEKPIGTSGSSERNGILYTAEFYAKKDDGFFALYRYDTTVTGKKNLFRGGDEYLSMVLMASIQKMQRINTSKALNGKKLELDDIRTFNQQRLNIAILNNVPKKGIYMSFMDFCNNNPLTKEFTIDRGNKGDFLYIKNDKNEEVLVDDAWGYSDGSNAFIYSSNNFFKLYRTGNAFKIFGAKQFSQTRILNPLKTRPVDLIAPNSNFSREQTSSKYNLVKEYLQLDMENGKLY